MKTLRTLKTMKAAIFESKGALKSLINKHNDERRSKSLFYANLYTKHQVVTSERLIDIISTITSRLYNNLDC